MDFESCLHGPFSMLRCRHLQFAPESWEPKELLKCCIDSADEYFYGEWRAKWMDDNGKFVGEKQARRNLAWVRPMFTAISAAGFAGSTSKIVNFARYAELPGIGYCDVNDGDARDKKFWFSLFRSITKVSDFETMSTVETKGLTKRARLVGKCFNNLVSKENEAFIDGILRLTENFVAEELVPARSSILVSPEGTMLCSLFECVHGVDLELPVPHRYYVMTRKSIGLQ